MTTETFFDQPPNPLRRLPIIIIEPKQPEAGVCPTGTLACDSVTATRTKCDPFVSWIDDKHYLTYSGTFEFIRDSFSPNRRTHDLITFSVTVDPDTCEQTIVCSTVHRVRNYLFDGTPDGDWVETDLDTCDESIIYEPYSNQIADQINSIDEDAVFPTYFDTNETWHITFDDEYTNALLLSTVITALPPYCGIYGCDGREDCDEAGQGCECTAIYELSEDESTLRLQRPKYKIPFSSTLCAGATVTWTERFTPSDAGPDVDTPLSYGPAVGDETEIGPYTIPDPTENGSTSVVDISVDCTDCET